MRCIGRYPVAVAALACWAALSPSAGAAAGQPYSAIVQRNIFGLLPIPVVDPASLVPATPLPKITPNGIMNIFGQLQALFKVAAKPLPGQPAKDASYVLSVGERQDDIEVVKIDEADGVITFNNHGTIQELSLVAAPPSGGGAPPSGGIPMPGGRTLPVLPGGGLSPTVASALETMRSRAGQNNNNPNASGQPGFGSGPGGGNNQPQERLTPEAQIIMMERQRAQWLDQGNPAAAIIPPTPLTSEVIGGGGNTGNGGPPAP